MIPAPKLKTGSPILVSTETLVPIGGTANPNLANLKFSSKYAVLVDEIRFRTFANVNTATQTDLCGQIRAMIDVGQHGITLQPTPLWSFGRLVNDYALNVTNGSSQEDDSRLFNSVVWRLPAPLYLHPSSVIRFLLQNFTPPGVTTTAVNVNIALAGRVVLPGQQVPGQWPIPAVAFYEAPDANFATSNVGDLKNPFLNALHVQRLIGRAYYSTSAGQDYIETLLASSYNGATEYIKVRMKDRMNMPLTKDFVGLQQLIDPNTRSWNIDSVLEANDYYIAEIDRQSSMTGIRTHLSMVGHRMENI